MASDITGTWSIAWTDEQNNSGTFQIQIGQDKGGVPCIIPWDVPLPLDCASYLGNASITGQAVKFTLVVMFNGSCADFHFSFPAIGGSGSFDGSLPVVGGFKYAQGTCTSTKVA